MYALLALVSTWLNAVCGVDPPSGSSPGTFDQYFEVTWGGDHVHMQNGGAQAQLTLDQVNSESSIRTIQLSFLDSTCLYGTLACSEFSDLPIFWSYQSFHGHSLHSNVPFRLA